MTPSSRLCPPIAPPSPSLSLQYKAGGRVAGHPFIIARRRPAPACAQGAAGIHLRSIKYTLPPLTTNFGRRAAGHGGCRRAGGGASHCTAPGVAVFCVYIGSGRSGVVEVAATVLARPVVSLSTSVATMGARGPCASRHSLCICALLLVGRWRPGNAGLVEVQVLLRLSVRTATGSRVPIKKLCLDQTTKGTAATVSEYRVYSRQGLSRQESHSQGAEGVAAVLSSDGVVCKPRGGVSTSDPRRPNHHEGRCPPLVLL